MSDTTTTTKYDLNVLHPSARGIGQLRNRFPVSTQTRAVQIVHEHGFTTVLDGESIVVLDPDTGRHVATVHETTERAAELEQALEQIVRAFDAPHRQGMSEAVIKARELLGK